MSLDPKEHKKSLVKHEGEDGRLFNDAAGGVEQKLGNRDFTAKSVKARDFRLGK